MGTTAAERELYIYGFPAEEQALLPYPVASDSILKALNRDQPILIFYTAVQQAVEALTKYAITHKVRPVNLYYYFPSRDELQAHIGEGYQASPYSNTLVRGNWEYLRQIYCPLRGLMFKAVEISNRETGLTVLERVGAQHAALGEAGVQHSARCMSCNYVLAVCARDAYRYTPTTQNSQTFSLRQPSTWLSALRHLV